jgi:hypothetical protein
MIRNVIVRFPFNGMPKGHRFSYDTEIDLRIPPLIAAGLLADLGEMMDGAVRQNRAVLDRLAAEKPAIISFEMPSIESSTEFGVVGGEGEDQPHAGGAEGESAHDSGGAGGLQGDQGTRPKVAKRR